MCKRKTVEFSPEADLFGPWFGQARPQAGPSGGGPDRSGGAAKLVFWQGFRPGAESVRRAAEDPAYSPVVVTQHTTACCSIQVVDITLVKYQFTNITSLRVVQQKHSGIYSSTEYYKP
jgi:hypothetical protein